MSKLAGFIPLENERRDHHKDNKFSKDRLPHRKPLSFRCSLTAFTLIEILIVVAIIAILALAILPNYIGFDIDARVVTTKSNLSMLRNRISLYRAKEGRYPLTLKELLDKTYSDAGIQKPYLKQIPAELITDKKGNSSFQDQLSTKSFSNAG